MFAKQVIAANRFTAQNTVTVNNPVQTKYDPTPSGSGVKNSGADGWTGLPDGTVLPDNGSGARGPNCVVSIGPDGSLQARPQGTAGGWETCSRSGGIAQWTGTGCTFIFPCEQ